MGKSKKIKKVFTEVLLIVPMFILLLTGVTSADQWAIEYEGIHYARDTGSSIQQTTDGGYIVAGNTQSFGAGVDDFWILKLNSDGTIAWQKTYGGTNTDWARSIQQTSDGGYIVAGETWSFGAGEWDYWVLKLNSDGTVAWQKTYGGSSSDYANSIQQTSDEGYIVAGETWSFGAGEYDYWVLKLNSDGTVAWQKTYGGSSSDYANSIQQTSDGGYIVAGWTWSFGAANFWVLKLNSDGTVAWQKTYGGSSSDEAYSIQQTSDEGYIVAGRTYSSGADDWDFWVLKLNSDGTVAWQKTYGGDEARSIQQTSDGGYILAGTTYSSISYEDILVLKLNTDGAVAWQKTYDTGGNDYLRFIRETTDGNFVLVGWNECPYYSDSADLIIIKIDANGEIPGCNIVGSFEANVTDTLAIIADTNVIPQESSVVPSDTDVLPQDTSAVTNVICGVPPNISVSPMSHNFGSVYVGSTSIPQTFTISNTGGANLVISSIGMTGGDAGMFSVAKDTCTSLTPTIAPGGSCTIKATFSSTGTGARSTTMRISSNDPDENPFDISLSGTGAPVVECSFSNYNTSVPRGGTLGFTMTIKNNTSESQTFLAATKVTKPDENPYPPSGYLLGPVSVTLDGNASKSPYRSHNIPDGAPLGTYTYHGYVGNYGVGIYDECTFEFEVVEQQP
jgi:uncharacterized delta-60 repeat protein